MVSSRPEYLMNIGKHYRQKELCTRAVDLINAAFIVRGTQPREGEVISEAQHTEYTPGPRLVN